MIFGIIHNVMSEFEFTTNISDPFVNGFITALFFTNQSEGDLVDIGSGFSYYRKDPTIKDVAPATMALILVQCATFKREASEMPQWPLNDDALAQAGRDFLYTRDRHGCGFWDGDWPEPLGAALTALAKSFGDTWAYVGDDGKVYMTGGETYDQVAAWKLA